MKNIIKAEVILKAQSTFWIFLHSNEKFTDKTAVISFRKEEYCDTVYITLGVFMEDEKKELIYQPFCQRQLIVRQKPKINNDELTLKIAIKDTGSEKLEGEVLVGESEFRNSFCCDFFIPVDMNMQEYKVMIAGSGEECRVNRFLCHCQVKSEMQMSSSEQSSECKII